VNPEVVDRIISISKEFQIEAQLIGRTENSTQPNQINHLTIENDNFQLKYG
jgi:hypothetical protein